MKLKSVEIENYRAVKELCLHLDPQLTVLHGDNAHGKTSVLSAIALGLGAVPSLLPDVSGIGFLKKDRHAAGGRVRVSLTATNGIKWERSASGTRKARRFLNKDAVDEPTRYPLRDLKQWLEKSALAAWGSPVDLPIMAFYDTERAVRGLPKKRGRTTSNDSRYAALEGALSARTNFRELFEWFYMKENEELRKQRERRDHDFRLKELTAVRDAISMMIDYVDEPHVELRPLRFVVSEKLDGESTEQRTLDQLSGGCQAVLALAADLAWRMVQGNPHRETPLDSEAVVLIDEVELHLHPSWQQRILGDLHRTFPNAQFIVSTHSPQVLTTVEPNRIVNLHRDGDRIVAGTPAAATYGAEAGDVLSVVMGVNERPPENEFTKGLDRYRRLIRKGHWESEEALALRTSLEEMSPYDPALDRADLEIQRRKLFEQRASSQ
ncbi:MAG: AAA family ATPase [Gemmatimonadota bacterium]|nr:AAA family ATPase [Gemmatimonadota bacterium]